MEGRIFLKEILEDRHLYLRLGGVPCIDALLWDTMKSKVDFIKITTDKGRTFFANAKDFDSKKVSMNYGEHGKQYTMHRDLWTVLDSKEPVAIQSTLL